MDIRRTIGFAALLASVGACGSEFAPQMPGPGGNGGAGASAGTGGAGATAGMGGAGGDDGLGGTGGGGQVLPPNDPSLSFLWGLDNQGQTGGTPDADIDAFEAWTTTRGSREVIVAVLDTGVDYRHEDLAANMWTNEGEIPGNGVDDDLNGYVDDTRGWDFFNGDNDPFDDGGHGTHVAGIIGAVGNNGIGVVGVNHRVRIMPLKIQSGRQVGSINAAIEAIDYAIAMGARVMSNSWAASSAWGEPGWDQPGFAPQLQAAIQRANAAGVLFVATAGNSNENKDERPIFPASYDNANIVSVAATDAKDAKASWSSYGPTSVDLAAPGVGILSTTPSSCRILGPPPGGGTCDGSGYLSASGTSMATPHVAGVAALVIARYPGISVAALKHRLLSSVDDLPGFEGLTVTEGRLNAASALENDDGEPATVIDLTVTTTTSTTVTLEFTAPGDDGELGRAREYDVRYSTSPIDRSNFASATEVSRPPRPLRGGSPERVQIEGLFPFQTYYFALRAVDNVGSRAQVSNSAVGVTANLFVGK